MSLKLDEIYFCIFLRALASHGSFIIRHVPPGDYILRAVSAGYGPKAGDLLGEQKLRVGDRKEHTSELQSLRHLVCRPQIFTLFPYTTLFRSHVPPGDYILRAVSAGYGPKAGDLLGEQKLRV